MEGKDTLKAKYNKAVRRGIFALIVTFFLFIGVSIMLTLGAQGSGYLVMHPSKFSEHRIMFVLGYVLPALFLIFAGFTYVFLSKAADARDTIREYEMKNIVNHLSESDREENT